MHAQRAVHARALDAQRDAQVDAGPARVRTAAVAAVVVAGYAQQLLPYPENEYPYLESSMELDAFYVEERYAYLIIV